MSIYNQLKKYAESIYKSKLEWVTWEDLEDQWEAALDETCEPFKIGSMEYSAGRVLREIDPIAFQCDVNSDGRYEEVILDNEVRYYLLEELEELITELEEEEENDY